MAAKDPAAARPDPGARRDDQEARKGFLVRLPPSLLAELRGWANQEVRSLNGHIEFLLRDALRRRRGDRLD